MTKMEEIRTMMGMSGAEVARRIGVSKQAYYNYEKGDREAGYENLLKIAEVFGVSVDALLDRGPLRLGQHSYRNEQCHDHDRGLEAYRKYRYEGCGTESA